MNTFLNIISDNENEEVETILSKMEEIRRVLKTFKSFFNELVLCWELYGKNFNKTLKSTLTSLGNIKDPSNIITIFDEFSLMQDLITKQINQNFSELGVVLNTVIEEFFERINVAKKRVLDITTPAVKHLASVKTQYIKNKQKYERQCKEAENAFNSQRKAQGDVAQMYNVNLSSKHESKTKLMMKEVLTAEMFLKEIIDLLNTHQHRFQKTMQDSYNSLKLLYRTSYDKTMELTNKYNIIMITLLENSIGNMKSHLEALRKIHIENKDESEENFIEEKKYINASPISNGNVPNPADVNSSLTRGLYLEITNRVIACVNGNPSIQDSELQIFSDLAQKHLETYLLFTDDRKKLYKLIRNLISEFSQLTETFAKNLQRNIKNNSLLASSTPFTRNWITILEPFVNISENMAKKYLNFAMFLSLKVNTIDNIIKEQKINEKKLETTIAKIIKDNSTIKSVMTKGTK
jgi:hypothetical protein